MAAGSTYTPIATYTAPSAQSSYTFSSISGSYTDLILQVSAKTDGAGAMFGTVNSLGGSPYSQTRILGNGTTASSARRTLDTKFVVDVPNTEWSNAQLHYMNYSNTSTYKTVLIRGNSTAYVTAVVALIQTTAAISSITLTAETGNFVAGSTFTLYGIAKA